MDTVFLLVRVVSTVWASTMTLFTTSPSTRTTMLLIVILICAKLVLSHHFVFTWSEYKTFLITKLVFHQIILNR